MAKKPNYDFERRERDRAKAGKKADKAADKANARREQRERDAETPPSDTTPNT
jgi:hypothetical protein